jgi:hypothetical protein
MKNYYTNRFFEKENLNNEFFIGNDLKKLNDELDTCTNNKEYWGNDTDNTNGFQVVSNYGTDPIPNAFINIYDINKVNYGSRYNGVCSPASQTIATDLGNRLTEITDFFTTELTTLKNKEVNFKNTMDAIYENLNLAIDTSLDIISDITDKLNENVGEDGQLWGMINCKFMGEGLKVLLKNIHDGLGSRFVNLGSVLASIAFLEAFAIVFTLITLNANSNPSSK